MQLINSYRPENFDQIVGQKSVVRALKSLKKKGYPHTLLFTGPSGCGKTTLARIIAKDVGCAKQELLEIDGATHTGVDTWREIKGTLRLLPLQGATKAVIVDECHMLSKNAWNALLKDTEEPPNHVYWILCTTELTKVPLTIRNRCTSFTLTTVDPDSLLKLVDEIAEEEGINLAKNVGWEIVEYAEGSPRKALTGLSAACAVESVEEAREVLAQIDKQGEVIEICRGLVSGQLTWKKATNILSSLPKPYNSEGMRRAMQGYFMAVALKSNESNAGRWLAILEAFGRPYVETTSLAPFLLSLGKLLLDE